MGSKKDADLLIHTVLFRLHSIDGNLVEWFDFYTYAAFALYFA